MGTSPENSSKQNVKFKLAVWDMVRLISFMYRFDLHPEHAKDLLESVRDFEQEFWRKVTAKYANATYKKFAIELSPYKALTLLSFLRQPDVNLVETEAYVKDAVDNYEAALKECIVDEHMQEAFAERFAKKCTIIQQGGN